MIDPASVPSSTVDWTGAHRIVRCLHPPIDFFEDIADPADWPLLIAVAMKTDPQFIETLGALDLVPPGRRVSGPGATYLMAPFTHVSEDRPNRFSRGDYGVLYAARAFDTALLETMYHHACFMARTNEPPGWTSQFRELVLNVSARLHDLRGGEAGFEAALDPEDYGESQRLAASLRGTGSDGIAFPSVRHPGGYCVGLFYPDLATQPVPGSALDYHWNGNRIDFYRDVGIGAVYRV